MKYFIILTTLIFSFVNADIEIVASKGCQVNHISEDDIKKVFMLKTTSIDDEPIKVLDIDDKQIYKEFIQKYLNKSPIKIRIYWTRMIFTGNKLPPKKVSLKELNSTEYENSCYLSYVKMGEKPKNWKTVTVK